jgi:O-antigen polymerase
MFVLGAAATLAIASRDPIVTWGYEAAVFLVCAGLCITPAQNRDRPKAGWRNRVWIPLAGISVWGFAQLLLNATVYRWATLDATLRFASYGATTFAASLALANPAARRMFLSALAWFGAAVSAVSVLAYFTSPGKILWFFPSPYPDVWGPFLSRNNFAQFLEITLPVSLWLALREGKRVHLVTAAAMLAAGFASGSRAGAILLTAEVAIAFLAAGRGARRELRWFLPAAALLAAVAGANTLVERFQESDPLRYRREIFQSTAAMIAERPWQGYGLGTYAVVYPEFAVFDSGAVVEHAHSDWLEWAAEGGLLFALLWAALASALCRRAIRSIWGLGLVALFCHALVDFPFARPGVAAWAFILAGAMSRVAQQPAESARLRKAAAVGH